MNRFGALGVLVTGAVALVVLWSSTFIVYPNEQALVLRFGEFVREASEPGLYFRIIIAEDVVHIDRRVLKIEGDKQPMLTGDQTPIVVDYFARYQIVNPLRFYQTVRTEETMQQRLTQLITSQLRRVLANLPLSRILTSERSDVMREISAAVDAQVRNFGEDGQGFGIKIIDVRIKRVDLPPENSEKVYSRMQNSAATGSRPAAGRRRAKSSDDPGGSRQEGCRHPGQCAQGSGNPPRRGRGRGYAHLQ